MVPARDVHPRQHGPPAPHSDLRQTLRLAEKAADAVFGFEEEIAIVDIETTGFDPDEDEIIEIAALLMRGPEILDRFQTFVATQRPIPLETTRLTGITDADLKGSPGVEAAVADLAD